MYKKYKQYLISSEKLMLCTYEFGIQKNMTKYLHINIQMMFNCMFYFPRLMYILY